MFNSRDMYWLFIKNLLLYRLLMARVSSSTSHRDGMHFNWTTQIMWLNNDIKISRLILIGTTFYSSKPL